ncbi:hypothetical protein [Xylella fastidiosa]|uniref:Uncharacterized protein n=1 Tax=Xylella fastidiosa subsp. multiplex TaxID=644357 RepID=A0A9Q4MKJ5_XYLFS|nr:hypothetical protein [Xylella fastidiosa]MBE0268437.1 hypothetical protein [Xylella fastidiosa subsp. multiplex]MBE0277395.1 hypothetical protein [Xylella fastidiosa subsp. multiplex]MBS9521227.1 hypothetical protein [Xylella fastidiosa subsp. multiplex]MRT53501.1 hypothetical protein [Xylella fastidiosa subsp. multiplex]MRU24153.1 hypothetical protein [Xylella fastidiosa subsp. multiplex]
MGRLRHYDNAKFFRIEQRPLNNLHDFVTLLSQLEHDLRACVPACLRACVPAYRGDAIATAHDLEGDKKRDYYSGSLCRNACK